jgi:hypothetical protein
VSTKHTGRVNDRTRSRDIAIMTAETNACVHAAHRSPRSVSIRGSLVRRLGMSTISHPQTRPLTTPLDTTRALLRFGTLTAPVFVGASILHGLARPGFDLTRHGISMLMLGSPGWIQVAIFELAGLATIACAIGARRVLHPGRAGTWGPRLIGGYGLGLLLAGLFAPDPAFGFPPGTPDAMPTAMSGHGALHAVGFFVSMISLIAAAFVFTRRFVADRQWGWAACSAVTGLASPALVVLSIVLAPRGGIALITVAMLTAGWITALSARLLAHARCDSSRHDLVGADVV